MLIPLYETFIKKRETLANTFFANSQKINLGFGGRMIRISPEFRGIRFFERNVVYNAAILALEMSMKFCIGLITNIFFVDKEGIDSLLFDKQFERIVYRCL